MKGSNLLKAKELVEGAKTIGLVGHLRMDPDSFGCVLGLQESLHRAGKKVVIFSEEKMIPFVANASGQTNYEPQSEYQKIDLIIVCDTAVMERIAAPKISEEIKKIPGIVIDHHATEVSRLSNFIYLVEIRASASELCYEFVKECGLPLSKKAANYFYVGLISDSNDLKYSSVTQKTRELEKQILNSADEDIRERIMEAGEKDRKFKEAFYKHCFNNTFESKKYDAVITKVKKEDLLKFNMEESIGSQLANFVEEQVEDKASFVFMEMLGEDKIKVSMRSNKTGLNVREIAEKFGGGGHDLAAGFSVSKEIDTLIKEFS